MAQPICMGRQGLLAVSRPTPPPGHVVLQPGQVPGGLGVVEAAQHPEQVRAWGNKKKQEQSVRRQGEVGARLLLPPHDV